MNLLKKIKAIKGLNVRIVELREREREREREYFFASLPSGRLW